MILSLTQTITSLANNFKGFIIENSTNPVLWSVLFFGGILIFWAVYNSLHKNG